MTGPALIPIQRAMATGGQDFVNLNIRRLGAANDRSASRQPVKPTLLRRNHSEREWRRVGHFHIPAANFAAELADRPAVVQSVADFSIDISILLWRRELHANQILLGNFAPHFAQCLILPNPRL